jgi:acetolactate synthase-1/3 small subunit
MKRTKTAAAGVASHAVPADKPAPAHNRRAMLPPASAYFIEETKDRSERHVLSIIVDNEPGVLARVIGLFSGRGYNIDSLTVSETEHAKHLSRITIVTTGTPMVLSQIRNQLDRMVPVHAVIDLTADGNPLERELALVKVTGRGNDRVEALRIADAVRAEVVGASTEHFIFQLTGRTEKIEQFIAVMSPLGLSEVCRTDIAALSRGSWRLDEDDEAPGR